MVNFGGITSENLFERIRQMSKKIPERHIYAIAIAEWLYEDFNGLKLLDIACGHNFPYISWRESNNVGPLLAGYFASKGAEVIGIDQWHFRRHKLFTDFYFKKKWGSATKIAGYFNEEEFDLVTSMAYFGYPSSENDRKPSKPKEFSIMEQAFSVTKKKGYGIHMLLDGYWQLEKQDLEQIGYNVIKYIGQNPVKLPLEFKQDIFDNFIILEKP